MYVVGVWVNDGCSIGRVQMSAMQGYERVTLEWKIGVITEVVVLSWKVRWLVVSRLSS